MRGSGFFILLYNERFFIAYICTYMYLCKRKLLLHILQYTHVHTVAYFNFNLY